MSDPTARRGDNIKRLITAMKQSKKGWTDNQIKTFLFRQYRYGVSEQTLDRIFEQLKLHNVIYGKKKEDKRSHMPAKILWYPLPQESPSF